MPKKSYSEGLSFFFYLLIILLISSLYFSIRNILIFTLEDNLNLPLNTLWILSHQYGDKAAALLVSVPIFMILYAYAHKFIREGKIDLDSPSRIWLLRALAFVTLCSASLDLYRLLTRFFLGELEWPTLLVTKITLFLALAVFFFSLFEMKWTPARKRNGIIGTLFIGVTTGTFLWAIYQAPPWEQRILRQDLSRVDRLQDISRNVDNYFQRYIKLPNTLDELVNGLALNADVILDPVSKEKIEYRVLSPEAYELCAVFTKDSQQARRLHYYRLTFNYHAGRSCQKYVVNWRVTECEHECRKKCHKIND